MNLPFSVVLSDSNLFGEHFKSESWNYWKQIWESVERDNVSQLFVCKGRGSGGSRMIAARGLHACVFCDWTPYLSAGEIATALILATDVRQASEVFGYSEGLADSVPMISEMIARRTRGLIEFSNRTRIEVRVSNFRKVRGYSLCFAGMDEASFWQDDAGANHAKEVYNALLPALGRLPNSFLMAVSTPWSASGFFYEMISKHSGKVA